MIVNFTGHGDDSVCFDLTDSEDMETGDGKKGYCTSTSSNKEGIYLVSGTEGSCYVYGRYEENACWAFSVGLVKEDFAFPTTWAFGVSADPDCGYSTRLTIITESPVTVHRVSGYGE